MKIYVASSWRNQHQPTVVLALRREGHEVYDFRDRGFSWEQVDPEWKSWNVHGYLHGLAHPAAVAGFDRDMDALRECDICVFVMPCGVSASMEAGWAKGAGKKVVAYIPEFKEAELMLRMFDFSVTELAMVLALCHDEDGPSANRHGLAKNGDKSGDRKEA